jgi:hypothetical protein
MRICLAQQQEAAVRRKLATIERGSELLTPDGWQVE